MNRHVAGFVPGRALIRQARNGRFAQPGEVSHRNSGNDRGCFAQPDVRTRLDGVWFHHRVSWTPAANNRPRRFYAVEIYGWPRCNSPTETDRRSQINLGKRCDESTKLSCACTCVGHARILSSSSSSSFPSFSFHVHQPPSSNKSLIPNSETP